MGLREIAQADARAFLNDTQCGAGIAMTVTAPSDLSGTVNGWANDIAALIDPDTGQAVSGRMITVSFHVLDLQAVGLTLPHGVHDKDVKPWRVSYTDEFGTTFNMVVVESEPDRTLGFVNCSMELHI